MSTSAGSGDPTNGTDDGSGPLRTIVDAAGNPLTGNYDIEVTLYPQIYYIGGSNALHQLALGEPSFSVQGIPKVQFRQLIQDMQEFNLLGVLHKTCN